MARRFSVLVVLALLVCGFALAQTPTPPPSVSPTPPPGGTMPPGYACQDPDNGVWVPDGGMRTKVTSPALTGGSQTVTTVYLCQSGSWRMMRRTTIWNSSTGMAIYPPGAISENGTRQEQFDTATGCLTYKDEMIGRRTKTQAGLGPPLIQDDRCIWTTDTTDCQNPESSSHRKIERWVQTSWGLGSTYSYANAGYTETSDSVGYDQNGALVEDRHSSYERKKAGSDGWITTTVGPVAFEVNYYETGQTVDCPMSYSALFSVGGGPGGGSVWSGMSKIPQYDEFGDCIGYGPPLTIGQILGMALSHEYLKCGGDDGSGWPWDYPLKPMP
jgi:hypothetical protein